MCKTRQFIFSVCALSGPFGVLKARTCRCKLHRDDFLKRGSIRGLFERLSIRGHREYVALFPKRGGASLVGAVFFAACTFPRVVCCVACARLYPVPRASSGRAPSSHCCWSRGRFGCLCVANSAVLFFFFFYSPFFVAERERDKLVRVSLPPPPPSTAPSVTQIHPTTTPPHPHRRWCRSACTRGLS